MSVRMSSREIRYCAIHGSHKYPQPPARVCRRCEDQMTTWLERIPDTYALLDRFIEHGTTERNPDSKATKRTEAPAPMRLEIIDLLDHRLGRRWLGTDVTEDRRGALGALLAIAQEIQDGRSLTAPLPLYVTGICAFLQRHLLWLTEQEWVSDTYDELKQLNRALSDAVGDYRPKPVGRCHVVSDDNDDPCGGPLLASRYGGVHCGRCQAVWDATHLRQLGLAQAQEPV